jgi:hypothetical protein
MKKKIIGILISMMILSTIPVVTGETIESEPMVETKMNSTSLFGLTIIAGYILNPTETQFGRINANAVALLYYDRGIIQKDSGILTGFQKISFKNTQLIYMNEPGPLGLSFVFGICSGFIIGI